MPMNFVTKLAIGGAVILSTVMIAKAVRGGRMRSVKVLGQNYLFPNSGIVAPWARVPLGNGSSSIGGAGCIEVSMTMAFNSYNPDTPMTPDVANGLMKSAGAFAVGSSSMVLKTGANALGLDMPDDQHTQPADVATIHRILDKALSANALALLRVYHGGNRTMGDHTVLVYGSDGSNYLAADPALVRPITFNSNLVSADGALWGPHVPYEGMGVAALYDV